MAPMRQCSTGWWRRIWASSSGGRAMGGFSPFGQGLRATYPTVQEALAHKFGEPSATEMAVPGRRQGAVHWRCRMGRQ